MGARWFPRQWARRGEKRDQDSDSSGKRVGQKMNGTTETCSKTPDPKEYKMPRSLFQSTPVHPVGAGIIRTCKKPKTCGPGLKGKYRQSAGKLKCAQTRVSSNGQKYCRQYKVAGKLAPVRKSMSKKNVALRARRAAKRLALVDRLPVGIASPAVVAARRRALQLLKSASVAADRAKSNRQAARARMGISSASGRTPGMQGGMLSARAMLMPMPRGGATSGGAYSGGFSVGAGCRPCTVYRRDCGRDY
jgi:hypothetical protein